MHLDEINKEGIKKKEDKSERESDITYSRG